MPIYTLGKKTYEILPKIPTQQDAPSIDPEKLQHIATYLSEYFGCFMLLSMSLKGEPQIMIMASSPMEQLALKQFAQDVLMGDADIDFASLEGDDGDGEYRDSGN